jgi:hypothetical protein
VHAESPRVQGVKELHVAIKRRRTQHCDQVKFRPGSFAAPWNATTANHHEPQCRVYPIIGGLIQRDSGLNAQTAHGSPTSPAN